MQLRYSFRLYPSAGQRAALARAFGCARVVYNDALRARETARGKGLPFPKTGDLSRQLITEAKNTPERAWLGEVSAVVLQQSLRDLDTAYRNFFDGPKPLHVRGWECGACGVVLDRDINAAVNVAKAAGLAVSACGAQVRPGLVPAPRGEAGTHPTPQPSTAR
ncbi:helix-turn-helix domain-containing protein [Streptomyces antibioticus]